MVKKAGVNVLVRKRMEHRKMMYPVCEYYPNCYKGDKCLSAHGKEESRYWTGMSYLFDCDSVSKAQMWFIIARNYLLACSNHNITIILDNYVVCCLCRCL